MLKLLPYLKGYRVKTILGPLFKLVEAILELLVPVVVAKIIDEAIPAGRAGDYSLLTKYGVYMLALAAVGLLFALVAQYFASCASMGFGTNLRKGLYEHINTLSQADVDKFGAPSLMTRLVGDTTQCQQGVAMFIRLVTRAPFVVIGSIIMAITIAPKLSLIFIGASLLIAIILYFIMSHSFRAYGVARGLLDDVSLSVRENLNGVRVIRAFSRGDREKAEFNRKNDKMTSISIAIGNVSNLTNPASYAIINIAVILVLWLGGKQVYYGNLSQGSIIALVNYLTQIMIALFGGKLVPVGTVDRHLEKLRAERGTADAVDDRRIELFSGGTFDHAGADLFDKVLHLIVDRGAGINGTVREMRDLSVLIGIFDLALFDFLHFKIHADEFLIESVDVLIRKIHSGKIDLKSAFAVNEGISVTPVDPFCSHFRPPWKFSV